MHIPLHRCLVAFGALCLFLTVLWVGLQSVIVVFPEHTHLLFTYLFHTHPYFSYSSAKEWDRGYLWGWGYMQFLEHVMWNIDQNSLVSRGWPCGASYAYCSQLRNL